MGIATDLIYIVIAALIGGLIAHLARQPLIIGYILAGVLVGPHTAGPTVERQRDIEMLAEVGAALLLFTLGLKISLRSLRGLSRVTFIMTPMQILATMGASYSVGRWFELPFADSVWIGAAVALSSTMVVLKTLSSRNTLDTEEGRMMLGILIAQDLAVIPIMLIVPQLGEARTDYSALLWASASSLVFLGGMYLVGTRVLPRLFAVVTRLKSRELFLLMTLSVALGAGFLAHAAGLSFALGAFVAGMLLSETDFQYQALSDIGGLRDLFGLIFFVSVGMLFDPSFFIAHVQEICVLTLGVLLAKSTLIWAIVRMNGYGNRTGVTVGLGLSQMGEFAFVIANAGMATGQLAASSFHLVISIAVLSMIATPSLFALSSRASRFLSVYYDRTSRQEIHDSLADHVVIIGGGTIGGVLGNALKRLQRQFVVIESDYDVVLRLRAEGFKVIYGDGSTREVLEAAELSKAALLLIATTHDELLPAMVGEAHELHRDLPILVRVHELGEVAAYRQLLVRDIVQPQLEASLAMLRQALRELGMDEGELAEQLVKTRSLYYASRSLHEAEGDGTE